MKTELGPVGVEEETLVSYSRLDEKSSQRTRVVHVGELEKSSSRMQNGDRDLGENRTDDGRLAKGASSALEYR